MRWTQIALLNQTYPESRSLHSSKLATWITAVQGTFYNHQVPPPNHTMIYIVNSNNYILLKNLNHYHSQSKVPMSEYSFITGKWVAKQIPRAKRGTAVDQWGWDSKKMLWEILNDAQFLEEVAAHWILPVAAGYHPIKYQDHLAGGRLVAISKSTKTRNLAY